MEQAVLQYAMRQRVGTHQQGCERTRDDFQRGVAIGHWTGLADTVEAGVGPEAYPGAFALAPVDMKRLDLGDMQCCASSRGYAVGPEGTGRMSYRPDAARACRTFSAVIGSVSMRTPTASA